MLAKTSFTKFVPKKAELFYIKLKKKIKKSRVQEEISTCLTSDVLESLSI